MLQYHSEGRDDGTNKEHAKDEQLQALAEITAEFLADICIQIPKVIPKEHFANFPVGSDCLLRLLNDYEKAEPALSFSLWKAT